MFDTVKVNAILNIIVAIFTDYDPSEDDVAMWTSFRIQRDAVFKWLDTRKNPPEGWPLSAELGYKRWERIFTGDIQRVMNRVSRCVSEKCTWNHVDHLRANNCASSSSSPLAGLNSLEYTYALFHIIQKHLYPLKFVSDDAKVDEEKLSHSRDMFGEILSLPLNFLEEKERFQFGFYLACCKYLTLWCPRSKINMSQRLSLLKKAIEKIDTRKERSGNEFEELKNLLIGTVVVPVVVWCEEYFDSAGIVSEWLNKDAQRLEGSVDLRACLQTPLRDIVIKLWKENCKKKVDPHFEMQTHLMRSVQNFYGDKREYFLYVLKDAESRRKARQINPYVWKRMLKNCNLEEFSNETQDPLKNF